MIAPLIRKSDLRLDPRQMIGQGGEAEIYDIGNGLVAKIFKPADHPDYALSPADQEGARIRLSEHQRKFHVFPENLPSHVITPQGYITEGRGRFVGYTMRKLVNTEPLMRYSERSFRQAGIDNNLVIDIFRDLYRSVIGLHKRKVIIGDFNDLNVLVDNRDAYLIDVDSYQFGGFYCRMFTTKFIDPLICNKSGSGLAMSAPYVESSDWYAYAVMLMQSLLYVDPYGGIYRPKDKAKQIVHDQRPLRRITVFDPEVRYPKPAIHYSTLPDDLLNHFHNVFEKDRRGQFPLSLLDNLRWTKCPICGLEHARQSCPHCIQARPEMIKETVIARGHVLANRIFQTDGLILFARAVSGSLNWLYHSQGEYRRESGQLVARNSLESGLRFRLCGPDTLIAKGNDLLVMNNGNIKERVRVDSFGQLSMFDANSSQYFWAENGVIMTNGQIAHQQIGEALEGQTLFWTGDKLGFGFYRVGKLNVFFVFDPTKTGINDSVKLPLMRGQLEDSTCVIGDRLIWFFTTTRENGQSINRCYVIDKRGNLLASSDDVKGGEGWLSAIRGKCSAGDFLLASTDDGIVRLEIDNGKIIKAKEFPDTATFVDSGSHIFPGNNGLFVVKEKTIDLLKIN